MTRIWHILTACLCLTAPMPAATYFVAKTGNDSNPGTQALPWLTLAKAATKLVAGDTVVIGDGDYNEHVQETTPGSADAYITYKAANARKASLRAFRVSAPYINLDGLSFARYSGVGNTWGAAVRIEPAADYTIVRNCEFVDQPSVVAHDFTFISGENRIVSPSSDFVAAGFVPGSKVYLGASGASVNGVPLYYVNHDTRWTAVSVDKTSMVLANGSEVFKEDLGKDYWAFVKAGASHGGFPAVQAVRSTGDVAERVTIANNKVRNWPAHAFDIKGNGFLIENNELSDLKSYRFLSYTGSDHVIRGNLVRNCSNILHYSSKEMETLVHPEGTGWYDYQVAMFSGFTDSDRPNRNVRVEQNWFENVENQIGRVDDELADTENIVFDRNVFIGVSAHFSGGRDGMKWTRNTFFRCGWIYAPHPLALGGRPPQQTGYELSRNLFVACGPPGASTTLTRGFYSISDNALNPVTDYNMVSSEEVTGFAAKTNFSEANGINGGDPVFYSTIDFLGPDGRPFTADDGLQVLPNSPAAVLGAGALGVYKLLPDTPVAHYRLTSPTGWFEATGESYNPVWTSRLPTLRASLQRPFDTPVGIGTAPVSAAFNAEKSVSGVAGALTNREITQYTWDFGDGSPKRSETSPLATHVFNKPGDWTVRLTVTNTKGGSHTYSNVYRVSGGPPEPPNNVRREQ